MKESDGTTLEKWLRSYGTLTEELRTSNGKVLGNLRSDWTVMEHFQKSCAMHWSFDGNVMEKSWRSDGQVL